MKNRIAAFLIALSYGFAACAAVEYYRVMKEERAKRRAIEEWKRDALEKIRS